MKTRLLPLFLLFAIFSSLHCNSQTLQTKNVKTGLDTPWEILWGLDDHIWMTERAGKVSRVNPDNGNQEVLITIPGVTEQSESGLLGMALHPDFSNTPHVFLAYTYLKNNVITEKIVRYEYADNKLQNEVVLIDNIPGYQNHDGCRLVFGPDGKLYISTGDAGNSSNSQNRNSINGKVLRMNPDGSVPDDNPYSNSYVWAGGSRNAQGLVWANGKLYGSEHGPNSDDEVNIYMKGRNYGWPNVTGFCNTTSEEKFCNDSNVVEPLYAWTPTLGVCGIDYYKTNSAISEWGNSLLLTSLKAGKFTILHLDENGEKITKAEDFYNNNFGRLRDVCVSPTGRVFISTSNKDGRGTAGTNDDRIIELVSTVSISGENHIYPAPKILQNKAKEKITITGLPAEGNINIYSISGKKLFFEPINFNQTDINCSAWPQGIYILQVENKNFTSSQKFMISGK